MEADPTRTCELPLGLGEVELVGIGNASGEGPLEGILDAIPSLTTAVCYLTQQPVPEPTSELRV